MVTIIEKIRAEVERRKGYISVTHFAEELLSFINSLQQEQPCNRAIYLDIMFSNMKRNEAIKQLEYLNKVYGEQSCETCTNDKGCVTCKDGELWEGKEVDLEKEIEEKIPLLDGVHSYEDDGKWYKGKYENLRHLAYYFYNLGKNAK